MSGVFTREQRALVTKDVIDLNGALEKCFVALTSDLPDKTEFHIRFRAIRTKLPGVLSDVAGLNEARDVRNPISHGEEVLDSRLEEAKLSYQQALGEILPHCPQRLQEKFQHYLKESKEVPPLEHPVIAPKLDRTDAPSRDFRQSSDETAGESAGHRRTRPKEPRPESGGGQRIGPYIVLEELGSSNMAVVYRALDPVADRALAIKVLRVPDPATLGEASEARLRFEVEVQTLHRLSPHKNIPTFYHYSNREDGDYTYFAMELAQGVSLAQTITATGVQRPKDVIPIIKQVSTVLDHAHGKGIVHRDIKPGNVLVQPDGLVKVIDFGIARVESQNLTATGVRLGTPQYMAPEQISGGNVGGQADQFSLGVLTYRLLTGTMPFEGQDEVVTHNILHAEPPDPRSFNPALPSELNQVLQRALKKTAGDRFETCLEFAAALESALCSHGTSFAVDANRPPGAPRGAFWGRRAALAGIAALVLATLAISGIIVHRLFPRWPGDSSSSNTPAKIDPSNQAPPATVHGSMSKPSDGGNVDNIPKGTVPPEQSIQNIQPPGRTIVAAVEKSPENTTADGSKGFRLGTKQDFKGDGTAKNPLLPATVNDKGASPKPVALSVQPSTAGLTTKESTPRANHADLVEPLINTGLSFSASQPNIAVLIAEGSSPSSGSIAEAVFNSLGSDHRFHFVGNLASVDRLRAGGFFDELYSGDTAMLRRIVKHNRIDYVLLAKTSHSCHHQPDIDAELLTCNLTLVSKLTDRSGTIVNSASISSAGPGFSEAQALQRAAENLAQEIIHRLLDSIRGKE